LASEKVRVQLDMRTDEVRALDALRDRCGLRSRADAVRTALAIVEWVEQGARNNKKILAVGGDDITQLVIPGLTNHPKEAENQ
jgi:hypothetical protein